MCARKSIIRRVVKLKKHSGTSSVPLGIRSDEGRIQELSIGEGGGGNAKVSSQKTQSFTLY